MKIALPLSALLFCAALSGCGPTTPKCTPSNCASGCCDSSGSCQLGTSANACGQLGSTCAICGPGQSCNFGQCGGATGGGSGGGTGGGSGGGGTGGGAMGGGAGGGAVGGGTGGGTGGGDTGGGTGGGTTGGGTGGGVTGGGTGGGVTGGGTGGGVTGGGTGGGVTGGGTGGGVTGGGSGGGATGGGTGGGGSSGNGESCTTAIALTPGQAISGQNLLNFISDYDGTGTGCVGSTASDAAYSVVVPAGQMVTVTATPDATLDATLSASTSAAACGTTCAAFADVGLEGEEEVLTWKNLSGASQTLFIVVDGYDPSSTGAFGLLATLSTPPADDSCSAPIALTPGVARTAQTFTNYSNDYGSNTTCSGSAGPDRVFSVAVGNGQRVTVTATPSATANVILSIVDGAANCGVTCAASVNGGGVGVVEAVSLINTSGATKTYLVVADFTLVSTGTFDIVANVGAAAADEVCAGATSITSGSTLSGQSTASYVNDYTNGTGAMGCSTGFGGPDRVYQFTVPNLQRGMVTVTPSGGYNPSVNIVEGPAAVCAAMPRVCAAGANIFGADVPEIASVSNVSGTTKTYFAIVDSASGGGTYNIGLTVGSPPANDTCTTSTVTLTSGTRNDNLTGYSKDYGSGVNCLPSGGPDRVYRVQLAANQKYSFTATPSAVDGGFDPVINFIPGPAANCEAVPRTCRGGADATLRNAAETGAFTNNTGATMDLYMVVGDFETDSTNRDFSLVSSIATAPAGESCQVPQAITGTASGSTVGASTDVLFSDSQTGCIAPTGPDRVFQISVANGQTLTATATPAATEDLAINLIVAPASNCNLVTSCLGSADTGFSGDPETATWTNNTGATRLVFIQVSSYEPGNFGLLTTVQ